MFTGIVAGVGEIATIRRGGADFSMDVNVGGLVPNPVIGESVALDGVCLTVVKAAGSTLTFDVSAETIRRSAFKSVSPGDAVNVERSLSLGERLGGHIVQGHVDCVGKITALARTGGGYAMDVEIPREGMKYVVEKGSITVSGISLTVASRAESGFRVALIPHTYEVTSLKRKGPGSTVNIEYDIIAKYVENLVSPFIQGPGGGMDREFLSRQGF